MFVSLIASVSLSIETLVYSSDRLSFHVHFLLLMFAALLVVAREECCQESKASSLLPQSLFPSFTSPFTCNLSLLPTVLLIQGLFRKKKGMNECLSCHSLIASDF